jgi:hypothetical protein
MEGALNSQSYELRSGLPAEHDGNSRLRLWWSVVAACLVAGIFAQAAFAGAMLSGESWASSAHAGTATLLAAAALLAGLAAAATLRRVRHGLAFAAALLALAALVVVQTVLGKWSANGANLMWLHVPLGVALVGLAVQALRGAGRLGVP